MKVMVFVSPKCPHCPVAWRNAQLASEDLPEVIFEKVRVKSEKGKQLSKQYEIMSLPTFVFKDGDNVKKIIGAISVDQIKRNAGGKKKSFLSHLFKKK